MNLADTKEKNLKVGRTAPKNDTIALTKILIVGNPNVGKSLLFNRLTGKYVTVSNYPGTTIEVSRGVVKTANGQFEALDTPGMYSLCPITEEEKVSQAILLAERALAVIHVIDAKNIRRMLGLTLQLIEAGLPVILVLNMADEARELGIKTDLEKLNNLLGIPVVETVATTGEGLEALCSIFSCARPVSRTRVNYGPELEPFVERLANQLGEKSELSGRALATVMIQDESASDISILNGLTNDESRDIGKIVSEARATLATSAFQHMALAVRKEVDAILAQAVSFPDQRISRFSENLNRWCMSPLAGVPILLLVLYFGLYQFVGILGAGVLVDFLQETLFKEWLLPWAERLFELVIPWPILQELFTGQYGIVTLGIRYAVAIIFPIVGTFFLAFSVIEDSGYLPRMAMLIDRLFKKIGLNGRAVIPLVLGFGCDTMATMVTRTLETRRERIVASILLALAIPCSAQIGLILALLAGHAVAMLVWAGFIVGMFILTGLVFARILPGPKPSFYMELPPLRLPRIANVLTKTYTRMIWYFKEVLPLFILASVFIWLGQITGVFQWLVTAIEPVVRAIGLPDKASVAFLFGFFRRDYGAAGLYDLQHTGALSGNQLTVAAITLTLFLPCIAQFLMLKKEQGWKAALGVSAGIVLVAFTVGFLANALFVFSGVSL